jgi:hypothetical protein
MQWRSPPKTDDEFVETVRKSVTRFDRWKMWWLPLLAVLQLAAVVGILMMVSHLEGMVEQFANPGINPNAPFVWGFFSVGMVFGLMFGHSVHSLFTLLAQFVPGMRTERLLLRYYDAYQHNSGEESPSNNQDDHSEDRH